MAGQLDLLPFGGLSWEDFERIQWQILRDVEGLRDVHRYGDRGQAQLGLDVIGFAADGSGTALQSKDYRKFTAGDLKKAVDKWFEKEKPFSVDRLVIGVSSEVNTTSVIDTLLKLKREVAPLRLELWDAGELSEMLRDRAEIVMKFFGVETARRFCDPFEVTPRVIPSADAAAFQEAVSRTPEVTTGAGKLLDRARELRDSDPENALKLVDEALGLLRAARFAPQAAAHEEFRAELLVKVGRAGDAARQLMDEIWNALNRGSGTLAQLLQQRFNKLPDDPDVKVLATVSERAVLLYQNPLVSLPEPSTLLVGDVADRAQLFLLAGESALADEQLDVAPRVHRRLVVTRSLLRSGVRCES